MNAFSILLLMILCHIIDDFVLQPICLSKLKQKEWWLDNVYKDEEGNYDAKKHRFYKNDYKMAGLIHAVSWSIMILLPFIFFHPVNSVFLSLFFLFNTIIHYVVDDAKANGKRINLEDDQKAHFLQIIVTFIVLMAG